MKRTIIHNGKLILADRIVTGGFVVVGDNIIIEVGEGRPKVQPDDYVVDAKGKYISPGFIDIHIHGGGGHDFMDGTLTAFLGIAEAHAKYGTTGMTPTTLTCPNEELFQAFEIYRQAVKVNNKGAKLLGFHLEGPYFCMNKKGAQDAKYIKNPDPQDYKEILSKTDDIVRWSVAPELPNALEMGDYLRARGIVVSVAHTDATDKQVFKAHDHGYTLMTHFYNAMSSVTRKGIYKQGGAVEAALVLDDMYVEIISDGIHVSDTQLKVAYKVKGVDKTALITDAMRGACMPNGVYNLGSLAEGQPVDVKDGVATLEGGKTLAGSVATTNLLVRMMRDRVKAPLVEAVRMASLTPAKILRIDNKKGSIAVGKDADIIIFDDMVEIYNTFVEGNEVYRQQ